MIKLDALILVSTANNDALDVENISDDRAVELLEQFHKLASRVSAGGGGASR